MAAHDSHTIKTYMSFAYPVDPANVKTLVDLDISYALSTTLLDWNEARSLTDGLAKPVPSTNENELLLELKPEAKWSDGSAVTASQVIRSIEHAKQLHDEAMKGLFELVVAIDAKDERTIRFKLNRPVVQSQILQKLTEPVYGVLFIKADGTEDLSKTTGPFTLKSSSPSELTMVLNPHWYQYQDSMAKEVVIRQAKPKASVEAEGFADDQWPNLMTSSSLMSVAAEEAFRKQHYSIWNRNLDRLFFFSPAPRLRNSAGRTLLQAIAKTIDHKDLMGGLGGFTTTEQFFPPGYPLFDPEFTSKGAGPSVPGEFSKKSLELLAAEGRVGAVLQKNIVASIKKITGVEPHFRIVALNKLAEALSEGKYDIAVLTVAVNDPNAEGPVSFLFGMNPTLIANGEGPKGDFKSRIVAARTQEEKIRNAEYRKVFTEAVHDGCVVPLFHFSSIAIARDGLDLARIPTTDETVAFAKVRFK